MGARCVICLDPRVQDIDAMLAAGRSARSLSAELGLPPESLKRHARNHAAKPATKATAKPPAGGDPLDPLDELVASLRGRALAGSDAAAREYRLALAAQTLRSAERPAYDVLRDPEWLRLQQIQLEALEPFPDARQAVAEAIRAALE